MVTVHERFQSAERVEPSTDGKVRMGKRLFSYLFFARFKFFLKGYFLWKQKKTRGTLHGKSYGRNNGNFSVLCDGNGCGGRRRQSRPFKGRTAALTLAKLAILSAISYILYMFVKFPLPMLFPSFLDLQISDLPALIGGFAMGPWYGCIIIVVKCLLKMPFTGTACKGSLATSSWALLSFCPHPSSTSITRRERALF